MAMSRIVAEFRDGGAAYLRKRVLPEATGRDFRQRNFTELKRFALKLPVDGAEETISRLHRVQADGHYWQEVLYFRTAPCGKGGES